jgi:hypothetical protein
VNSSLPRTIPLLAAAMAFQTAALSAPTVEIARRVRLEREHSFIVARPRAEAFRFFEPVGEKNWAEGWRPVFATEHDALLHDGSVFTVVTRHADGTTIDSVWTISRYDPPHVIEYRNVIVGVRVTRIVVRCDAAVPSGTRVTVRYTYTSLSAAGDAALASITEEKFRAMIDGWGQAIAAYLERGTPASP